MYRSGDLVRRTPKGDLEFLGRSDRQVKLRGYRVELSEIEFVLRSHASIATAAVVMHETGLLVAYCVPAAQTNLDTRVLHEHAVRMLPEFMVPSSYALLDKLPLTLNGKLDVRALPPPKDIPKPEARMPESDCEKLIAAVWSEVLGKETVTADDDFFALGAHSLMALRVVGRIKKRFGVKLSVTDAYRYSRLADLAKYVAELRE
jgi:acyl carrier protein